MRELLLANVSRLPAAPEHTGQREWPLSRAALMLSLLAHVMGGFMASRWSWTGEPPLLPAPTAEFVFMPSPRPAAPAAVPQAAPPVAPPTPAPAVAPPAVAPQQIEVGAREAVEAELGPAPGVAEPPAAPLPPRAVLDPLAPSPVLPRVTRFDLDEARQRAAAEVVEERASEPEYLTFSVDDVAAPRPAAEPERRSIFDGTGSKGVSAMTVGQARTRVGRRVAEICNALTGGFSFMGLGSFCAEADDEPSGLFPEVRPEILDLMPACEETRPLAAQLGEETEFPTIKCELVPKPELPARWSFPDSARSQDPE
jgi:hypothetical protein